MDPIINGKVSNSLSVSDRALQYGDGLFSTVRIAEGQPQLWPLHKVRLQSGLKRLDIAFDDWQVLEQHVQDYCMQANHGVLKVWISRGEGGRGYTPPKPCQPNWALSLHSLPVHYAKWRAHGVVLGLSPVRLAKQPLLAGIKHLNRLEQVLIKQDLVKRDWDDALVCDTDEMLVESSAANLFWRSHGRWFTPDLRYAGVEGVMRQYLLQQFSEAGHKVEQVRMKVQGVHQADSLFICNSLMGIVPVRQFDNTEYDVKLAKQFQEQWTFA
ncbi:aminodeoxychorismate lyase [Aliiglaciecola sp. CAU 1673]|uniref:aminodeoxychorismate lyase n=1 Tax=Aliiglaciecola sp. CAU 1673 TaxID=3032595 RepID=UPI0023D9BB6D|nr:aminodeoxychorismate lyase [Aliiglaciecola sp. CAU 1673]